MSTAIITALQKNRFGVPEMLNSPNHDSSRPNAPPNSLKETTGKKNGPNRTKRMFGS